MLDGGQNAVEPTEHAKGYARPVQRRVSEHICGVLLFSPQGESILSLAIDDAWAEKSRDANRRIATRAQAMLPGSSSYGLRTRSERAGGEVRGI